MGKLTTDEWDVLETLRLRPNGAPFRHPDMQAAVKALADRQLVCDPHTLDGGALFTRITVEGKATLAANPIR